MDTAQITWSHSAGSDGVDKDSSNPLARALDRLLTDGQRFRRLSLCFLDPNTDRSSRKGHKWIGAFVLSDNSRLIFFPGFRHQYDSVTLSQGKPDREKHAFTIDHITLEPTRNRWHVTSPSSKKHLPGRRGFPAADLGSGRRLWFGMSVSDFDGLREVKREIVVCGKVPPSDATARLEVFMQARKGLKFPCLKLSRDAQRRFNPGFLHLSVIVGPRRFESYVGDKLPFPDGVPYVAPPLPGVLPRIPVRSHRMSLPPELDLELITAWLPGRINVPVVLTIPG